VSATGGRFVSEEAVERGSYRYAYLLATLLTLIVIHPFLTGERPLTSVGYGDIVPLGGHARSLAMLEAIAGQMYLAIFMARLVGLYSQRR
jgi:hypothetical protein